MAKTILVVDDEENLRSLLEAYLAQEGFSVVTAQNGRDALRLCRQVHPDLIVLDLMMPEMSGYEFLRLHAKEFDTPVIILTARVEESDKVLGLEVGADDYVTKPFSPRELTARVRAVLRRTGRGESQPEVLRVQEVALDRIRHSVAVRGEPVELTPSEFDLLATLMAQPGRVFSRSELLTRMQGTLYEGYERTIDVHVRNLRGKIEIDPTHPQYVETVYGVGYRFVEERA